MWLGIRKIIFKSFNNLFILNQNSVFSVKLTNNSKNVLVKFFKIGEMIFLLPPYYSKDIFLFYTSLA